MMAKVHSKSDKQAHGWKRTSPQSIGEEASKVDSPEELFRDDARTLSCIRRVLIAALFGSTVLIAVVNSALLRRVQMRAFTNDFEAISSQLTKSFLNELKLQMWQAYSTSVTLTGAEMTAIPLFDQLCRANRATSCSTLMVYSPLLFDEAARLEWEANAREAIKSSNCVDVNTSIADAWDEDNGGEANEAANSIKLQNAGSEICEVFIGNENNVDGPGCRPRKVRDIQNRPPCHEPRRCVSVVTHTNQSHDNDIFQIFDVEDGAIVPSRGSLPYSPVWKASVDIGVANLFNQMSDPIRRMAISALVETKRSVFSQTKFSSRGGFDLLFGSSSRSQGPGYSLFYPVFSDSSRSQVAATISVDYLWGRLLKRIIPVGSEGIDIVLKNTCGQTMTFSVDDDMNVTFLGEGDLHDTTFNAMKKGSDFEDFNQIQLDSGSGERRKSNETGCIYKLHVFPSAAFLDRYENSTTCVVTAIMVVTFLLKLLVFLAYDNLVRQMQAKVMKSASRYNSFVSSLFPSKVRSRLFKRSDDFNRCLEESSLSDDDKSSTQQDSATNPYPYCAMETPKVQLKNFLATVPNFGFSSPNISEEPIADLFPCTTVFFADIAGFTAWSSEREPLCVFKLLETLYSTFDRIAASLGVFKVETVGDCYVAVTGLPEPQEDHAIIMAAFARECMLSMRELTRTLEPILGPNTASLALRIGMHSGPVIAGVLRGERSRFQLFGDTMNTCSRMESTGIVNKIQASQTTADILKAAGKASWITPREHQVLAKGKGSMKTYWINPKIKPSRRASMSNLGGYDRLLVNDREGTWRSISIQSTDNNLVDWNADLLYKRLLKIMVRREAISLGRGQGSGNQVCMNTCKEKCFEDSHPRNEVIESLAMPDFCAAAVTNVGDSGSVIITEAVQKQLRNYVARVASLYHKNNAFHNFEHASHVAMSASKLLNRIISPDSVDYNQKSLHRNMRTEAIAKEIHETTFGISSDPLLQFAAVFAALVHDVDHQGVPNTQLSVEMSTIAVKYNHKSVAEQHSVDTAWRLLMEDQYQELRMCICATDSELTRFRQLVVNAVIATDIADKSLQVWREARWERAFHTNDADPERRNRKASIVFAYILQASDVAHTMQHWHTYRKWNERLFAESYHAYQRGSSSLDPSLSWYEDEISFFDNYIIPLAQKLEECGVFGVSSHENLSYAAQNRDEWVSKGETMVAQMVAKYSMNT